MTEPAHLPPGVAVTVSLGHPLTDRLPEGPGLADLGSGIAAGLRALAARLGLPVEPEITIRRRPDDARPIRVQIDDAIHAYAEDATARLWEALADTPAPGAFAWDRWSPDAAGLAFLTTIVVETVKQHPERLLTAAHVNACSATPPPGLRAAFAAVLRMGIALPAPAAVADLGGAVDDPDLAEHLIAACRPRPVQVELRLDDLERLLDRDVAGPVALADLAPTDHPFGLLQESLLADPGVRLPPIVFVPVAEVPAGCVVVRVNDLDGPPVRLVAPPEIMVNAAAEPLQALGVRARPAIHPGDGTAVAVIDQRDLAAVRSTQPDLVSWTGLAHVGLILAGELRRHAARLVDTEAVEHELALLGQLFPELVEAVLDVLSIGDLARVLRGLVDEHVSIRDLRGILERLLAFDRVYADTVQHAVFDDRLVVDVALAGATPDESAQRIEHVRAGLRAQLGHAYAGDGGGLNVWMLESKTETRLLEHLAGTRPLTASELDQIRHAVQDRLAGAGAPPPPLFTLPSLRRCLRELIRDDLPRLPVLAPTDLPPSLHVEVLGRIAP